MIEVVVALLGAGAGLLILRFFENWNIKKGQQKLDVTSRDFDKIEARLEGEQAQEDKETKEKVNEITKEQNNKLTGSDLSNWFNRRK